LDKAEAKLMAVAPEALAKRELLKDLEGQVKSRGQELKTREILLTNIYTTEQFLGKIFTVEKNIILRERQA